MSFRASISLFPLSSPPCVTHPSLRAIISVIVALLRALDSFLLSDHLWACKSTLHFTISMSLSLSANFSSWWWSQHVRLHGVISSNTVINLFCRKQMKTETLLRICGKACVCRFLWSAMEVSCMIFMNQIVTERHVWWYSHFALNCYSPFTARRNLWRRNCRYVAECSSQ
jgi:hypothetical protein